MDQIAYYVGLALVFVGLLAWFLRPVREGATNTIKAFGFEFGFNTEAFVVMVIGILLMIISPSFPKTAEPKKLIVCTGQYERNCPSGGHNMFLTCGYFGSDDQIAANICKPKTGSAIRLTTENGNRCGYSRIEVTC